ncbi:hypothetical protein CEXT_613981 [Caerostris extrusa]|uniref:Uncharacterized protein n=1 Tax=Caerostris extrusa TaxID=172846 RepID=A0AAV4W8Z8_CAEEX|nr:hypothetical protein CEXT_613981 [Caerostris extrusa]
MKTFCQDLSALKLSVDINQIRSVSVHPDDTTKERDANFTLAVDEFLNHVTYLHSSCPGPLIGKWTIKDDILKFDSPI